MATLLPFSTNKIEVINKHAVFIHGLQGNLTKTWKPSRKYKHGILQWLSEDVEGLKIWTVGYPASISRCYGHAMHFSDRATNILERILREQSLESGEIILIGHSLGGVIIKQILRTAESLAYHRKDVSNFLKRVSKVAFLSTPHFGSGLASMADHLRIFIWPSVATASLVRNDSNLRDLNNWFREWISRTQTECLTLMENQPLRVIGIPVVRPDSSDPGLLSRAISVDANHFTVCKPKSRDSDIYILIRDFIKNNRENKQNEYITKTDFNNIELKLERNFQTAQDTISGLRNDINLLVQDSREGNFKNTNLILQQMQKIQDQSAYPYEKFTPVYLINDCINKEFSKIKKARFFEGSSAHEDIVILAEKVLYGELFGGTNDVVCIILGWCARLLAYGGSLIRAKDYLQNAKILGNAEEIIVAEAFIDSAEGNLNEALDRLSKSDSVLTKSASLFIVNHHYELTKTLEWIDKSGIKLTELDSEGKYFLITRQIESGAWDQALGSTNELTDNDFINTPALLYAAAMSYLVQSVTGELKAIVPYQVPFEVTSFPLAADKISLNFRRKAQELFIRAAREARELGCIKAAQSAEDYALWLELRDPSTRESGLQKLEESMRSKEHSLRRLNFALRFGLKLDIGIVEQEIERQSTISGGKSFNAAKARFTLAFTKKTHEEVADYINKHRAQMCLYAKKESLDLFEIKMLVQAGLLQSAENRLKTLMSEGISEEERVNINKVLNEAASTDPVEVQKKIYETSRRYEDLGALVRLLEERRDWQGLCYYGGVLFELTHALEDAELLASAFSNNYQYRDLVSIFRKYPEFLDQSEKIKKLMSWALYYEGELNESAKILKVLQAKLDQADDRILAINLAIVSGDWKSLQSIIEKEWNNRENREPEELMKLALLAQGIGSSRVKDLVNYAVTKRENDAHILSSAYYIASRGGWEGDDSVSKWLQKAAEISDEDGPFQKMSLQELLEQKPVWDQREAEMLEHLKVGDLPMFGVARSLNRSLIDLFLLPALANINENDPRKRALIPCISGARSKNLTKARSLAMDANALLSLGFLNLIDIVGESFECIIIPHSTLGWLFEENQKVAFHQPSRIEEAKKLRLLLSGGNLKEFSSSTSTDSDLANEIGEELAAFITEANAEIIEGERKKYVVRPAPVHRIDSLMNEEADLTEYSSFLCSCTSVINKLRQRGQLTASEEQRAKAFFKLNEKQWSTDVIIPDGAILYLDDLSVSFMQNTGLLGKLGPAGFEVYISPYEIKRINTLLSLEQLSLNVNKTIEDIRKFLANGIQKGNIKLGPLGASDKKLDPSVLHHPSWEVVSLAGRADALLVDDRFWNQQINIDLGSQKVPIITTLDLIEMLHQDDKLSKEQMFEYRTKMRQAGFMLIPVDQDELTTYLSLTAAIGEKIVESAELKAIRENILQIKMSQYLQLPKESLWLYSLMQTFFETLKSQWSFGLDEATVRAHSKWILNFLDIRSWSHCQKDEDSILIAEYGHRINLNSLIFKSLEIPTERREKYWLWLEENILSKMKEEDPETYLWLIQVAKKSIRNVIHGEIKKEIK
ncbi:MAG: esterase/lipase family protein [Syntrophomonadaceae bacterium]